MSFEKQLERLTNAINRKKGAALGREVVVETQDLRELIFQFNRVDKELREHKQNFKQKEFEYRTHCQNIISTGRVEADNLPDRFAELEKVILDYYLDKGYQVGVGEWCFRVDIMSHYKQKGIFIYFYDNTYNESVNRFFSKTTKEMWDKAIKHFSLNVEPIQEDTKIEVDTEKYSSGFKVAGYASDGRE